MAGPQDPSQYVSNLSYTDIPVDSQIRLLLYLITGTMLPLSIA